MTELYNKLNAAYQKLRNEYLEAIKSHGDFDLKDLYPVTALLDNDVFPRKYAIKHIINDELGLLNDDYPKDKTPHFYVSLHVYIDEDNLAPEYDEDSHSLLDLELLDLSQLAYLYDQICEVIAVYENKELKESKE